MYKLRNLLLQFALKDFTDAKIGLLVLGPEETQAIIPVKREFERRVGHGMTWTMFLVHASAALSDEMKKQDAQ